MILTDEHRDDLAKDLYETNNTVTISSATGCFSSDTLVTLVNQQQIPIGKLQVGDELLSIDGNKVISTEMVMMLDQNQLSSGYLVIYTII
ncbi:unnamed protein product [Rotaria sp. Silwood1]|nr:unnamed protein product [Rotaria sp. Silwood1]